jgi:pimeloyl-ACP methyl ester carboxylesterase
MPIAQLNGIDLYYKDHGTGAPVVLMHGYSDTSQAWRPQIEALGSRYRLVTLDMRGHGRTVAPDDPEAYSEAHVVADLSALLRHLGIARAVIGGLSLGGYMSLRFYLAHPEVVRALVLCDTGPGYRNAEAREDWNRRAFARAEDLEARGLAALRHNAGHTSATGLARAARGMLAQFDSAAIDVLPKIAVPTLVIVGSEDKPFLGATEYMARKIGGARRVVIDGAGHVANVDRPEPFNAALLAFLDEVS